MREMVRRDIFLIAGIAAALTVAACRETPVDDKATKATTSSNRQSSSAAPADPAKRAAPPAWVSTGISALRASELARPLALKWRPKSSLVDLVSSAFIGEMLLGMFTPSARRVAAIATLADPSKLTFRIEELNPREYTLPPLPIVLTWLVIYKSDDEFRTFEVSAEEHVALSTEPLIAGVGASAISALTMDSIEAVRSARNLGATPRTGYFRVTMQTINGSTFPAWTLPFQMADGQYFVMRADTGEIVIRDPTDTGVPCKLIVPN